MNGVVGLRRIPPIRQKKGEWMGHGGFWTSPAPVPPEMKFAAASQAAPHERGDWASSYPTHATEKSRTDGARELVARKDDPGRVHLWA